MTNTPTREEMLKVIYEKVAYKTDSRCSRCKENDYSGCSVCDGSVRVKPIMIGDVLDWIEKVYLKVDQLDDEKEVTLNLNYRKEKRNPIDDQSDECIEFVYQLVQGE